MAYRRWIIGLLFLIYTLPCVAATDYPYRVFQKIPVVSIDQSWVPGSLKISLDGIQYAYIATDGKSQKVVFNGKAQKAYDEIHDLCFSGDGIHLAYIAKQNDKFLLVCDGVEGKPYDSIVMDSFLFSPDGKRYAYVSKTGAKWLVVDETGEGKPYDEVGSSQLKFSPNSQRLIYPARSSVKWFLVSDGKEGKAYDGIRALVFSPDSQRIATVVRVGTSFGVVVDNKEGPAFAMIKPASLLFSPDSRRIVYVAEDREREFVVINHRAGKAYHKIISERVSYSPDGSKVAFAAQLPEGQFMVVDGVEGKRYPAVMKEPPIFSPDGRRLAYAAFSGTNWMVVVNGVEQPGYASIGKGTLLFSNQGSRFAYIAKIRDGHWVAVVDGFAGGYYDNIGQNSLTFSPDEKNVVYSAKKGEKWLVVLDDKESRQFDAIVPNAGGQVSFDGPAFFYYLALEGNDLVAIQERIADKSEFRDFKRTLDDQAQVVTPINSNAPKKEFKFHFNPPSGIVYIETVKTTDLIEAETMSQERRTEEIKTKIEINKTASGWQLNYQIISYLVNDVDDPEGGAALSILEGVRFSSNLDSQGNLLGYAGMEEFDKNLRKLPSKQYRKYKEYFSKEAISQRLENIWKSGVENFIGKSFKLGDVWESSTQIPLPNGATVDAALKMLFKEETSFGTHQGVRIEMDVDFNSTNFRQFMAEMLMKEISDLKSKPEISLSSSGELIIDPNTMLSSSGRMDFIMKALIDMPSVGEKELTYKRISEISYDY